jgi:glycine cleavage system H protein
VNPAQLLYSKTHEWAHVETDSSGAKIATIGISAFAVESLTDLVFLELPKVGRKVTAGEPFGEVESVKAVSDLYCPVDGEIVAVNSSLSDQLERLNHDCYGDGWLIKVRLATDEALGKLLDYEAYQKQCAEEH